MEDNNILPLYSEVLKNLWLGGTADEDTILESNRDDKAFITDREFDTSFHSTPGQIQQVGE